MVHILINPFAALTPTANILHEWMNESWALAKIKNRDEEIRKEINKLGELQQQFNLVIESLISLIDKKYTQPSLHSLFVPTTNALHSLSFTMANGDLPYIESLPCRTLWKLNKVEYFKYTKKMCPHIAAIKSVYIRGLSEFPLHSSSPYYCRLGTISHHKDHSSYLL